MESERGLEGRQEVECPIDRTSFHLNNPCYLADSSLHSMSELSLSPKSISVSKTWLRKDHI